MKKTLLASLLSLTVFSNTVFASSIHSEYSSFKASRLQSAFPHTVSRDGSLLIEEKLTATDYASILFSLTDVQNNSPDLKNKIANTLTGYNITSEFLFVRPDGAVITAYDYKDGEYISSNKIDVAATAQFSIAYHNMLKNIDKFNIHTNYQNKVKEIAFKNAHHTSNYIFKNMYQDGKFFDDAKKEKVDYKTMANGLISFSILWDLEKDSSNRKQLAAVAKDISNTLHTSWNEHYNVFDFNGNGEKVKFDLRDFGLFLWGTSELAAILAETGYGYEALNLMINTDKMASVSLVNNVTSKKEGIAREIEINKGIAVATRDEINTGRLHTFLYGFIRWNENPFTKVIGTYNKNAEFAKSLVLFSAKNHMDSYAIIHDTLFSDPAVKNDAKETPYLTWAMITSDYIVENYHSLLTNEELSLINKAIEKNYHFLMNNIFQSGKSINEKLGF